MAGPAGNLLSGSHARRASEGSLTGLERRAEIAFQRDRDREGGGLNRQLACESLAFVVPTVEGAGVVLRTSRRDSQFTLMCADPDLVRMLADVLS